MSRLHPDAVTALLLDGLDRGHSLRWAIAFGADHGMTADEVRELAAA